MKKISFLTLDSLTDAYYKIGYYRNLVQITGNRGKIRTTKQQQKRQ